MKGLRTLELRVQFHGGDPIDMPPWMRMRTSCHGWWLFNGRSELRMYYSCLEYLKQYTVILKKMSSSKKEPSAKHECQTWLSMLIPSGIHFMIVAGMYWEGQFYEWTTLNNATLALIAYIFVNKEISWEMELLLEANSMWWRGFAFILLVQNGRSVIFYLVQVIVNFKKIAAAL